MTEDDNNGTFTVLDAGGETLTDPSEACESLSPNAGPYGPHRLTRDLEKLFGLDCGDDFAELYSRVMRLKNPLCSVCAGDGQTLDGGPCICGGSGREVDEVAGLRLECLKLRDLVKA